MEDAAEPGHRPTIRDVAAKADVSKSLVSLVLQNSPRVSEASRAAVQAAIDELGYRPNSAARSLVRGRSGLIGIVTSNPQDYFYLEVIEGISAGLGNPDSAFVPLVLHGSVGRASENAAVERFMRLGVESLLFMGSSLTDDELETLAREVPVCLVGRWTEAVGCDVVTGDDYRGATMAARHLVDLGHRTIAHINGGHGNGAAEREAGFRDTVEQAGLEPIVVTGAYTVAAGQSAAREILEASGARPSAVFAANDLCAFGAIDAFQRKGHGVPEDISVVGYDDLIVAGLKGFDLTTVNQAARQMGHTAARMTELRLETGRTESQKALIEPALIERATTRAI